MPLLMFWSDVGWNVDTLQALIPLQFIRKLEDLAIVNDEEPRIIYSLSDNSEFNLKNTYTYLLNLGWLGHKDDVWSAIFSAPILPHMQVFMWRLYHDWVPTDGNLLSRGICLVSACSCRLSEEATGHLFVKCCVADQVWIYFSNLCGLSLPFCNSIAELIKFWLPKANCKYDLRASVCCCVCWGIWQTRNSFKYSDGVFNVDAVIGRVLFHLTNLSLIFKFKIDTTLAPLITVLKNNVTFRLSAPSTSSSLCWTAPAHGCYKFSLMANKHNGVDVIVGLLGCSMGFCWQIFSIPLLDGFYNVAGLIMINLAMDICIELSISNVVFEVLDRRLYNWLAGRSQPSADCFSRCIRTTRRLQMFPDWSVALAHLDCLRVLGLIMKEGYGLNLSLSDLSMAVHDLIRSDQSFQ